jgi:thiol-disulfide isomerase/thioredoxin
VPRRPCSRAARICEQRGAWLSGLLLGLAPFVLASCSFGAGTAGGPGSTSTSSPGDSAVVGLTTWAPGQRPALHDLSGSTLAGRPLALAGLHGQVVVLNTWASWCYPCRTEVPALVAVARATAGRGVTFVGMDEQDTVASARTFQSAQHMPYASLVDPDGRLLARLGLVPADAIPSTLVVDRTGHVAARFIGPLTAASLTHVLDELAPI